MPEAIDHPDLMFGNHTPRDAAATFYHVGKLLDSGYGPVPSQPDPESSDVISVFSYGTHRDPYSAMKLTPLEGGRTDEYRVYAYRDHISIMEKRTVGDKDWISLGPGESIPPIYCDAVYDVERRIELGKKIIGGAGDKPVKFLSLE